MTFPKNSNWKKLINTYQATILIALNKTTALLKDMWSAFL